MSAEGTRVLARVRRVVRLAEYETFELTEEVEVYAEPGKSMELLTTVREKVIRSVNEACDVVAAAHRPGAPVAPAVSIPLQAAPVQPAPFEPPAAWGNSNRYAADMAALLCPRCGRAAKVVPAGVSKKTGKAYESFTVCSDDLCKWKANEREPVVRQLDGNGSARRPEAAVIGPASHPNA